MISEETPTRPCPPPKTPRATLAEHYWITVRASAKRSPALPMDHSEPAQGRCCIVPPATMETV